MKQRTRILIGAQRWQAWSGPHLLHEAVATVATIDGLLRSLPPGPVAVWLDRPDEQVVASPLRAQRVRDQRKLMAARIQPPGAQEAGWGRWLNPGDGADAPALLLQLQSPALLNQLVAALLAAGHAVQACHSHTLALAAAARGAQLYIAAGLIDGTRHLWLSTDVLRFTRLCPGAADSAQAHIDLEATLQHLQEQHWWNGRDPLPCRSEVPLEPALLARYPQLQWQAATPARVQAWRDDASEYPRPSAVARHCWLTRTRRLAAWASPTLGLLALLYAGASWHTHRPAPLSTMPDWTETDIARAVLQQLPPQDSALPERLRQLSLVLAQHPGQAVQRLEWQQSWGRQAHVQLSFSTDVDNGMTGALEPDAAWFAETPWQLLPASNRALWQLQIRAEATP